MVKKNTQASKKMLEAALQNLPVNRHTANVRTHIYQAINEIERVDKKFQRKAQESSKLTPAQQWKLDLETGQLVNPMSPKQQLDMVGKIDEMIATEKEKIDHIKQKQAKSSNDEYLLR